MKNRNLGRLALLAGAFAAMETPVLDDPRFDVEYNRNQAKPKTKLTKKQSKVRAKAKRAKKARRK